MALPRSRTAAAVAVVLAPLLALSACADDVQQGQGPADLSGPLDALPPCEAPPPAADVAAPEGMALPDGAVLTGVTVRGPLSQVSAYLPMTPVQVRIHYEGRNDLEKLQIEDEVFEAEVLVTDGAHRTYVKAVAVCALGSTLDVLVAAETSADAVPTPAGSPGS